MLEVFLDNYLWPSNSPPSVYFLCASGLVVGKKRELTSTLRTLGILERLLPPNALPLELAEKTELGLASGLASFLIC